MNRAELKHMAKRTLSGKWVKESLYVILIGLITSLPEMVFGEKLGALSLIITIALIPISFGYIRHLIKIVNGEESGIEDFFYFYKEGLLAGTIMTSLIVGIFTFLWTLLFIVPGIIASYRYSMFMYLKNKHPELEPREIIDLSSNMMNGHKMELFILHLSFIGWAIPAALTLVGILPLSVYAATTETLFYEKVEELYNSRAI